MSVLSATWTGKRPSILKGRFRFIEPTLPSLETVLDTYRAVYDGGTITNAAVVARFEAAVAERIGVRHCIAVSSCTTGLMLVLRALDLSGEILIPSFTFFATGHAALWNGLRPVFVDCDRYTWTVDPDTVERRITERTRAILAVHLYGNPCNSHALAQIASKYGLKLVFDAAHAFGSMRQGMAVGQFGDAEVFSLSPTKLLVAGEGGLVTTNDGVLARLLRAGRNYGDLGAYDPELLGINARMSEFNAAVGLACLDLMDYKIKRRQNIAAIYTELLSDCPGISFQQVDPRDCCTYKDYSILVNAEQFGVSRDEIGRSLLADNIETKRYFFPPLHQQALYRRYHDAAQYPLPNTEFVSGGILSLPIYESLPDETIATVAAAVQGCHRGFQ